MELIRWNPTRDMFSLRHQMNHLFDDVFRPAVRGDSKLSMWDWNPTVDIYDNDENIVIKAELPGIEKKDIVIDVKDGVLTLKGERSFDNEVKEKKYYCRERTFGKFERVFRLPAKVDPEKISADYKDGVLKIDIPKPEEQKPKQITVH
ncbi:MAG: Hsp20/alpha crystallin family protein [Desulfobacteraceae bacterium]|nr:Hsp20/alpha crystallin family protein [Desulfobacteraceae bacterium]MDH3573341.1 Hsp20/alpha crystallin family protein [Desulfobacteraceae bacterium]MDH3719950.1 Hsp20/alpha crystallin family protein [Desulfobacteraceae bacterium]MDH3835546.1 Hsp20/alpha crystallin family protein [Desulfobacteraceae bacterium]MDH3873427.1 Hsp20/alpha crystallin family protein [Desulfobacteraceae bacterium]